MTMFRHLGYYNGEDAVELQSATKEEIVSNMLNGFGEFHNSTVLEEYSYEELRNPIGHYDEVYVITISVSEPLSVHNEDCFIDIFEKV